MNNKILERIRKCLALAKSSNPNEAAVALKQALSLMQQHNIRMEDVELADVKVSDIRSPKSLATWQQKLVGLCCRLFGVRALLYLGAHSQSHLRFYGVGNKAELASYTYDVLLRQLRKSRRDYMRFELAHVKTSQVKKFRADEFCYGWVVAVHIKVKEFIQNNEMSEKESALLDAFKQKAGDAKHKKANDANKVGRSLSDLSVGFAQGEKVELNRAVYHEKHQQGLLAEN